MSVWPPKKKVCKRRNRNIRILRARFSALIPRDILNSVQNLVPPNEHQSKAVEARQEIDLRLGSAFTRFQTMRLQVRQYTRLRSLLAEKKNIYGIKHGNG